MLPYQSDEARILARDARREAIRARQYLTWLNSRHRPASIADHIMKHSANLLNDHRSVASDGRPHLFEGMAVMAEATR